MQRILRTARFLFGGLIAVLLIAAAVLLLSYPAEYLRRLVRYQVADVYDYQIFPERSIQPAPVPFHYQQPPDPSAAQARVKAWFEQDALTGGNLDTFLERTRTQAFIVIQDDTIVYEKYLTGAQRDSIVTSFSAAKSFVSTLVGIAAAEGKIGSLDDPITRYLPELLERDPRFAKISIRHLLNMSSGIKYVENGFVNGDDALTYYYPDLRALALNKTRISGEPGQTWLYNNYHPLLLGIILERATGVPVAEYLQTKLWQPLGAEYPASWSLDSEQSAFEKMESGINARAIDFAKLGSLYLHQGRWNGQQILPAEWVEMVTYIDPTVRREAFYPASMDQPYGQVYHQYLWWGVQPQGGSRGFAAKGNYGQEIFVYPDKNIVIVRSGEQYGLEPAQWLGFFMAFAERVER